MVRSERPKRIENYYTKPLWQPRTRYITSDDSECRAFSLLGGHPPLGSTTTDGFAAPTPPLATAQTSSLLVHFHFTRRQRYNSVAVRKGSLQLALSNSFRKPTRTSAVRVHTSQPCPVSIDTTIFYLLPPVRRRMLLHTLFPVVWHVGPMPPRRIHRKRCPRDATVAEITCSQPLSLANPYATDRPPFVVPAGWWGLRAPYRGPIPLFTCFACIVRFRFITPWPVRW